MQSVCCNVVLLCACMPSQSCRLVNIILVYCCSDAADVTQATARSAEKCACAPSSMCTHSGCIYIQAAYTFRLHLCRQHGRPGHLRQVMSVDLQGCVCLEACVEWDDGILNDQQQATASLLYTMIATADANTCHMLSELMLASTTSAA